MIRADMIPPEVVKAAARELAEIDDGEISYVKLARAAIAAALNAWPDVLDTSPNNIGHLVLQFKKVSDD